MSTSRPGARGPGQSRGTGMERVTIQALREAAARLVDERPDIPPGSVLRCFSRSVRRALLAGWPAAQVAAEAERLTRELLTQRCSGPSGQHRQGTRTIEPMVPQPRRAS